MMIADAMGINGKYVFYNIQIDLNAFNLQGKYK